MFATLKIEIFNERFADTLIESIVNSNPNAFIPEVERGNFRHYLIISKYPVLEGKFISHPATSRYTKDRLEIGLVKITNMSETNSGLLVNKLRGHSFNRVFISSEYLNIPDHYLYSLLPTIRN